MKNKIINVVLFVVFLTIFSIWIAMGSRKDNVTLNTDTIKDWQIGWTGTFSAYVNGEKVSNSEMTWSSDNTDVATCINGKLTAVGVGTANITCTKKHGTIATCVVNVVDAVTLNTDIIKDWPIGWTGTFSAYVNGEKVSNSEMIWSSDNTNVATCVNGKLTAVGAGTATITCTKENGTIATCVVTVRQ